MKWVCFCFVVFCCHLVRCKNGKEILDENLQSDNIIDDSKHDYCGRQFESVASSCVYSANIIKELSKKSEFEKNKLERLIQKSENKILRKVDEMRVKLEEKQDQQNRIEKRLEILIELISQIGEKNPDKIGCKLEPLDIKRNETQDIEDKENIEVETTTIYQLQTSEHKVDHDEQIDVKQVENLDEIGHKFKILDIKRNEAQDIEEEENIEVDTTIYPLQTSVHKVRNCFDILTSGDKQSGIRTVYLSGENDTSVEVICNQDIDGGGWTVFQTRKNLPIRENFFRNWHNYTIGFGNLTGEFWLGLTNIHRMTTTSEKMELRIELEDSEGDKRYAHFENFYVKSEEENFALNIGAYSGTAGDSLTYHQGQRFSTFDKDNDVWRAKCAEQYKGAWWYRSCYHSNLNGFQHVGMYDVSKSNEGICYNSFRGDTNSMAATRMMFRPQD